MAQGPRTLDFEGPIGQLSLVSPPRTKPLADEDAVHLADLHRFSLVLAASGATGLGVASAHAEPEAASFVPTAYVEAFHQWNLEGADNNITAFRGFDNRHDSFTLTNVAVGVGWEVENVLGQVTLQVGPTASSYYAAEPSRTGAGGASSTGAEVWKYIQEAHVGYRLADLGGLIVRAGLFLTAVGPEGIPIKDNWNWSRSTLFFALPYYHAGLRATLPVGQHLSLTGAVYNGWNNVVDNNGQKTIRLQLLHCEPDLLTASLLYLGGVERSEEAAEGRPWRHLFDGYVNWQATGWLALMLHLDGGFEDTRLGLVSWGGAALYARFKILDPLFITVRGDVFDERKPSAAAELFFPAEWVASGTLTVDFRPVDRLSLRLEIRRDEAADEIYFRGDSMGDGSPERPFVAGSRSQTTLTWGVVAWL